MRVRSLFLTFGMFLLPTPQSSLQAGNSYLQRVDSIRASLEELHGNDRLEAYQRLYRICLYAGDRMRERGVITEMMNEAKRQGNSSMLCLAKAALINYYSNSNSSTDSIRIIFPEVHDYLKSCENWRYYYETWVIYANYHLFINREEEMLRCVREMYDDARKRNDTYGIGLASYVMATAYHHYAETDEAIRLFEQAIKTLEKEPGFQSALVNLYPYYCGALIDRKDYDKLFDATARWGALRLSYVRRLGLQYETSLTNNYIYYCLFRAEALARHGRGHEAKELLEKAERASQSHPDFVRRDTYYRIANYYLLRGRLDEAANYNRKALSFKGYALDYMLIAQRVQRQEAEICFQKGDYARSAELLRNVVDSVAHLRQMVMRNQLNEYNARYQLDNLRRERQQDREWGYVFFTCIVLVSLFVLLIVFVEFTRRIRNKNKELSEALDRSEESARMKQTFVQHVSHEIRTPLNIISGFTQIIGSEHYHLSAEERLDVVNRINDNTRQITDLINELLEFSNDESAVTRYVLLDEVNMAEFARRMFDELVEINLGGLELRHELEVPEDFTFHTSIDGLRKVLHQLGNNAVKFTEKGSITCRMSLSEDMKWVEFRVQDTGIGIPEEYHERVFERFFKVDSFKPGLGLGLAVARRVTAQLEGTLTIDTEYKGQGTCFLLSLPNK